MHRRPRRLPPGRRSAAGYVQLCPETQPAPSPLAFWVASSSGMLRQRTRRQIHRIHPHSSAQRLVTVAIRPTSHTKTCRQDGCPNQQVRPNALTHSLVLALHAADQPGPSALSTGCAPSHRYVSNTSEEDRDIQGQADGLSCRSARDRAAGRTCDCGNDPASPRRARLRIMRNCRFFGS